MRNKRKGRRSGQNAPGKGSAPDQGTADPVDEASIELFPASDPPAWIPQHPGRPAPANQPRDDDPPRPAPTRRDQPAGGSLDCRARR